MCNVFGSRCSCPNLEISIIKNGKSSYGRVEVYKQGSTKTDSARSVGIKRPTKIEPLLGAYDIKVTDDQNNVKMFKGTEIKAGKTETIKAKY